MSIFMEKYGPNQYDVAVLPYGEDIPDDNVPIKVYEWDDEASKTITSYGNGISGDATELVT